MSWTHLFSKVGLGRVLEGFGKDLWWIFKVADHLLTLILLLWDPSQAQPSPAEPSLAQPGPAAPS